MQLLKSFFKKVSNLKGNYLANILGFSGLIPFIFLFLSIVFLDAKYHNFLFNSFFLYSAIILSFIGGVYWGFSITQVNKLKAKLALFYSVFPAIIAWAIICLVNNIYIKSILFLLLFNLIFICESKYSNYLGIPIYYIKLRQKLNIIINIIFLALLLTYSI